MLDKERGKSDSGP